MDRRPVRPPFERGYEDALVAGVCSGLAPHLGVSPIKVRVLFAVLTIGSGAGVLCYGAFWAVVPRSTADGPVRRIDRVQLPAIGAIAVGGLFLAHQIGISALDRARQVVAFCGDGGVSMLLGDLITAVSHQLPVKLVVFDNGRLGMVKLEMEQVGLPEFGTVLHNPDFAKVAEAIGMRGIRVTDPTAVDDAVAEAFAHDGPVLLDVVTNPEEVAVPPRPTPEQVWGFAIAKTKEFLVSPE